VSAGPKIHQYHPFARRYDAVTNHMRAVRQWLKEVGIGGEVFARDCRGVEGEIGTFSPDAIGKNDWLLIHHSLGDQGLDAVLAAPGGKALVYHNITPAKYLAHDAHLAKLAKLGRQQLKQFLGKTTIHFADSHYNAFELEEHGLGPVKLLPLLDLSGETTRVRRRLPSSTNKRILFVGRIAPHKAQAELVKVLYFLKKSSALDFTLVLVGSEDPLYGRYVRGLIKSLGLSSAVEWHAHVSDEKLQAIYDGCDAFLSLSRHEGFGIPLVEAIRHELPVFAWWRAGVTETMGGAGVGLLTSRPHRVAEVLLQTLLDTEAVDAVLAGQAERWLQLQRFQNKATAQKTLSRLVKHSPAKSKDLFTTVDDVLL